MTEPAAGDELQRDVRALLAGYGYLLLAGAATLLLAPLYLRLLGADAWGAVALCLTVQGVLFGLDAMFGPLVLREAARARSASEARAVFDAFLRRYAGLGLILFVVLQCLLTMWSAGEFTLLVRLALVQFLFQFANLAIVGYWQGRGQQVRASVRLSAFLALRHALALVLILVWRADARSYLIAFAAIATLELGSNLVRARRDFGRDGSAPSGPVIPQPALPLAFVAAALSSMLGAHLDRLWFAATLPASRFGIYFLLGSLLLSLLHLQMPIQRALLPRIAADPSPRAALRRMLWANTIIWLPALALALAAAPFLRLWLGTDATDAESIATLTGLMLAAIALTFAAPAQSILLRDARYRALAAINLVALAVQSILLASLTSDYGMRAGAAAWFGTALVQWFGARLMTRR